jgi:hypothetical protein
MSVVEAKIQTVEEMYRLIWTAIENRQPISAIYKERPRLFCPHRLGRIVWANLAYSAISMAVRARAVWGRSGHRRIGGAWFSRNCAVWNWWTVPGRLPQTILVQRLAWWMQILTPTISRSATRRRDIERSRRTGAEPRPFSGW